MALRPQEIAFKYFNKEWHNLHDHERRVIERLVSRYRPPLPKDGSLTTAQRLSDRLAAIGGSWSFIIGFFIVLTAYILLNSWLLIRLGLGSFDPYPYIFLNLMLSMLAAIQAPVIMMSQNRLEQKDRARSIRDYEINVKAELEISEIAVKLEDLKELNLRQTAMLEKIVSGGGDRKA